jgi:hypothetical protein
VSDPANEAQGTEDEPRDPRRGGVLGTLSVIYAATKSPDTALCFTLPLACFVIAFVVGRIEAPDFAAGGGAYSSFFSTVAQAIVAVLVALAFDLGRLPEWQADIRELVVGFSLVYIALGAAAAVIGLLPDLSGAFYEWLFAATLAAGIAAVLSVLTISYQVVKGQAEAAIK